MRAAGIDTSTSAQIAVVRVICIFFMMSVHVNPGFRAWQHDGLMQLVGMIEVDLLGRASVSTLGLVSGFLLAATAGRRSYGTLVRDRLRTLWAPMAFWNAVALGLAFLAFALFGLRTAVHEAARDLEPMRLLLERILFVHGAPATTALGFLRDLAVSSILLGLLLRIPRLDLRLLLPALLAADLLDALEPVIYRPSIPLFMLVGAILWRRRGDLHVPPRWRPAILALLAAVCVAMWLNVGNGLGLRGPWAEAFDLLKRTVLTLCVLDLGGALAGTRVGERIGALGDDTYLAYLSHTVLISALWMVWKAEIGDHRDPAYILFFLAAPALALLAARAVRGPLGALPAWAQILVRGKVRAPARVPTPRPSAQGPAAPG